MPKHVSFSEVERFLVACGYSLRLRRVYPGMPGVWFAVFDCGAKPRIAFPVAKGKVLERHFEKIKMLVELHADEDEA